MTGGVATRLDAAAVADFYQRVIAPKIAAIETKRQAAARLFWRLAAVAVFLNAVLITSYATDIGEALSINTRASGQYSSSRDGAVGSGDDLPLNLVFFAVIASACLVSWPITNFQSKTKAALLQDIVAIFPGFTYSADEKFTPGLIIKSDLFPAYDRDDGGDLIQGTYDGVAIESANLALITESTDSKGRKQSHTVFKGPVYHLSFPRTFRGETKVRTDGGWLGNKLGGLLTGLERVVLEDPKFESVFEVYSTDQIEARYILTTGFMELLLKVAARHDNKLEAAFFHQSVLLKVEGRTSRLQVRSPLRKIDWQAEVTRLIDEFQDAFALADELKLNQKIGL